MGEADKVGAQPRRRRPRRTVAESLRPPLGSTRMWFASRWTSLAVPERQAIYIDLLSIDCYHVIVSSPAVRGGLMGIHHSSVTMMVAVGIRTGCDRW